MTALFRRGLTYEDDRPLFHVYSVFHVFHSCIYDRPVFDVFYVNFQVLNVALLKSHASLPSSQRMLDRVVCLWLLKDLARLRYNVWIMVMVPALSPTYLKNLVSPLSDSVSSLSTTINEPL